MIICLFYSSVYLVEVYNLGYEVCLQNRNMFHFHRGGVVPSQV